MKALLSNYKQSPRKVGLVAALIRGKSVAQAKDALMFMPKKSSPVMLKLLNSAISNAKNSGKQEENLFVKTVTVDKGMVMRRIMPKARGRAAGFRRTMSIIKIELAEKGAVAPKKAKKVAAKKVTK